MDKLLKLSLLGAAAFVASNAAHAADLLPEPPVIEVPEVVHKKVGGWYIRGDIGYSSIEQDGYYYNTSVANVVHGTEIETDDAFNLRGGIGYQINHNFRVDATVGYHYSHDFQGTSGIHSPGCLQAGTAAPVACDAFDSADATRFTFMANAYADLGTFGGLTPYIGAGIGGAHVSYGDLTNTFDCGNATPATPNGNPGVVPCGTTDIHPGADSLRFAYALHAGIAYELTHKLKLDLGYSYTHVAGGEVADTAVGAAGAFNKAGPLIHDDGFSDHRVSLGLRYHIW